MEEDKFESRYQKEVEQLNATIGAQRVHIHKLEKEIEWLRRLAMNLSVRRDLAGQ